MSFFTRKSSQTIKPSVSLQREERRLSTFSTGFKWTLLNRPFEIWCIEVHHERGRHSTLGPDCPGMPLAPSDPGRPYEKRQRLHKCVCAERSAGTLQIYSEDNNMSGFYINVELLSLSPYLWHAFVVLKLSFCPAYPSARLSRRSWGSQGTTWSLKQKALCQTKRHL